MSDNHDYLRTGAGDFRLRADILALMMKGAGYGLIFCLALWLCIAVIAVMEMDLRHWRRVAMCCSAWSIVFR